MTTKSIIERMAESLREELHGVWGPKGPHLSKCAKVLGLGMDTQEDKDLVRKIKAKAMELPDILDPCHKAGLDDTDSGWDRVFGVGFGGSTSEDLKHRFRSLHGRKGHLGERDLMEEALTLSTRRDEKTGELVETTRLTTTIVRRRKQQEKEHE